MKYSITKQSLLLVNEISSQGNYLFREVSVIIIEWEEKFLIDLM